MEIDWILVGWVIDVVLNGIVWLIIAALLIPIIEVSDKWIRKILENSFEWIQKKNLNILFAILFVILFGILAQYEIIPKLIR